jgi:hypothetical protein
MIYDTKEYELLLDVPTDNFTVHKFKNLDTENIEEFIQKVKSDIPNSKSLIILFGLFDNLTEYDHWFDPLNKFCSTIDNPLVVFNGKLTRDPWRTVEAKFPYFQLSIFDHISNYHWKKRIYLESTGWTNDVHVEKKYKFYWASTKDWYTRRFILAGLVHNNLHHNNLINYKCIHGHIHSDYLNPKFDIKSHKIIQQECDSIKHLVPFPSIDEGDSFEVTPTEFYTNSYLGIITDTFFELGVFLSEKIFNAINYQQLFFYIGPAKTLEYLRSQGYQTFDNIFDTEYDTIEDNAARLFAARQSLINFLQQPIAKIHEDYIKAIPAIQHNKNLLMQQKPDKKFTQAIESVLNEH